jgi:hypothetical protein
VNLNEAFKIQECLIIRQVRILTWARDIPTTGQSKGETCAACMLGWVHYLHVARPPEQAASYGTAGQLFEVL